ncbi:uncharacterized protein LOC110465419 [Mizuhopecten yessoensis]|uniref:uncharacterized protein LOC110465419 n=1 Tax=Mizuhopecten yessoensis TaxID=6573 RepID=UPI000B45A7BA|nr:uncharacterized protein LOC110465419 [Mizuhopecten yessoensis]
MQTKEKSQRRGNRRNKIAPYCSPDVTDISQNTQEYNKEKLQMFETAINSATTENWTEHTVSRQILREDVTIDSDCAIPEGTELNEDNEWSDNETVTEHQIPEAMEVLEELNKGPNSENQATEGTLDKEEDDIGYAHQISSPESEHCKKPVLRISEVQVEPMDLNEATPEYSSSLSQNDHHQELISEETRVCKPNEELSKVCTVETTNEDDVPGKTNNYHQNGSGNYEEPPLDYQLGEKIDGGENSGTTIFTQSQIPKEMEERKRNKRIRENLDDGPDPTAKRNKHGSDRTPQSNELQTECKLVKVKTKVKKQRKNRRRQWRTLVPAPSSRNQETYASDSKTQAKDPATCSDAERGKHVKADKPAVNDDPLKTRMWTIAIYGVIVYTFLNSSCAVKCISIMSVSVTGLCIYYFMNAKSAVDIPAEHPASNPIQVPKKSSVEESEATPTQRRDLYRICSNKGM